VVTGPNPWSYAAQIPLRQSPAQDARWYWVCLDIEAVAGQIGVGLLVDECLLDEQLIDASGGRVSVFLRLRPSPSVILIRNGSFPGVSVVRVFGLAAGSCLREELCPSELS